VAWHDDTPPPDGRRWGRGYLLKRAFDREVSAIVVLRLAALGRNLNAVVGTLAFALRHRVRIVAVADSYDSARSAMAARLVAALYEVERSTNLRVGWVRPRDPCEHCPQRPRIEDGQKKLGGKMRRLRRGERV
jgi:hypothetical protein